jgi:hypothetical protein
METLPVRIDYVHTEDWVYWRKTRKENFISWTLDLDRAKILATI